MDNLSNLQMPNGWELCDTSCDEYARGHGCMSANYFGELRTWKRAHARLGWQLGTPPLGQMGSALIHQIEPLWPEPKKTEEQLLDDAIAELESWNEETMDFDDVTADDIRRLIDAAKRVHAAWERYADATGYVKRVLVGETFMPYSPPIPIIENPEVARHPGTYRVMIVATDSVGAPTRLRVMS